MKIRIRKEKWSFRSWGVNVPHNPLLTKDKYLCVLIHLGRVTYLVEAAPKFDE